MLAMNRSSTAQQRLVCMTRANCVKLYDALTALPQCPEVKVVMTGDLTEDPEEWSQAGHITTKALRDAIKQRMIDPDDLLYSASAKCSPDSRPDSRSCVVAMWSGPINSQVALYSLHDLVNEIPHELVAVGGIGIGVQRREVRIPLSRTPWFNLDPADSRGADRGASTVVSPRMSFRY